MPKTIRKVLANITSIFSVFIMAIIVTKILFIEWLFELKLVDWIFNCDSVQVLRDPMCYIASIGLLTWYINMICKHCDRAEEYQKLNPEADDGEAWRKTKISGFWSGFLDDFFPRGSSHPNH